jgi:hypothetical protein
LFDVLIVDFDVKFSSVWCYEVKNEKGELEKKKKEYQYATPDTPPQTRASKD